MIPQKQLSLTDFFEDCQTIFEKDKPQFLSLLEEYIVLEDLIPVSFYNHFYISIGRPRKYSLTAFLWAFIIQRIFSIPSDQLLLVFLHYSKPLCDFCGFKKIPDASKLTRFNFGNNKNFSKAYIPLNSRAGLENEKTLHADFILSGITQLITVILADKLHNYEHIRSLRSLIS